MCIEVFFLCVCVGRKSSDHAMTSYAHMGVLWQQQICAPRRNSYFMHGYAISWYYLNCFNAKMKSKN